VTRPRLGLALGSGSARGWAHIGILGGLAGHGLMPQVIAGASVGALVGAAYAAGRLADLERWVTLLTQRDVWRLVDTTFRGGGVMTGSRLMEAIAARIGDALIETLPVAYGAVATDLYTGEEIWLRDGSFMTAVRASSGLPGLFAPTWHEGRWLIDGGVVNPLPVSLCRALGADVVIAVDLSRSLTTAAQRARRNGGNGQPVDAVDSDTSVDIEPDMAEMDVDSIAAWRGDGLPEDDSVEVPEAGIVDVPEADATNLPLADTDPAGNIAVANGVDWRGSTRRLSEEARAIARRWSGLVDGLVESYRSRRNEPGVLEVMSAAVNIMQHRITGSRLAIEPAELVLHPDLSDFQIMDFHRAREAIDIGRACVEQTAEELEPIAARLAGRG
jgi:NTE family protein